MKQISSLRPSSRRQRRGLMAVMAMVALVLAVAYTGQLLRTSRQPGEQARSAHCREQLDWLLRAAFQRAASTFRVADASPDTNAAAAGVWEVELDAAGADAGQVAWRGVAEGERRRWRFTAKLLRDGQVVGQESRVIDVLP